MAVSAWLIGQSSCCWRLQAVPHGTARRIVSAHRPECGPQFVHQGLRLLEGGEVSALRFPAVMDELRISPLGPTLRDRIQFVRELGDRDWSLDAERLEEVSIVLLDAEA